MALRDCWCRRATPARWSRRCVSWPADADLRQRLSARALELAARATIESESERVAAFINAPTSAAA